MRLVEKALGAMLLLAGVIMLVSASSAEVPAQLQPGTLLPVMLSTRLDAHKDKPGKKVKGRLMQAVWLVNGEHIPRGASVQGRIVEVTAPSQASGSRLALTIDQVIYHGKSQHFTSSLRALASMMDVYDAQLPTTNFADRGTTIDDWVTEQVGGDVVLRAVTTVFSHHGDQVARTVNVDEVRGKPLAVPSRGCRAGIAGNEDEQAFWIFSTSACGVYGLEGVKIAHAGRAEPRGEIVLESGRDLKIAGGSGWLLRVN
jgi:hypothetical protein